MKDDVILYSVVYRLVFPDGVKPLFIEYFDSLSDLFEYVRLNRERWDFYSVNSTLEVFNNQSSLGEIHVYKKF